MGSHIEIFDRSDLPSVTVRFEVSRYACCKEELMEAMCISQLVLAVTDAFEKHGRSTHFGWRFQRLAVGGLLALLFVGRGHHGRRVMVAKVAYLTVSCEQRVRHERP